MNKPILLLVVACILLWATSGLACWRHMIRDLEGDPDEFQTCRVHNEVDANEVSYRWRRVELRRTRKREDPEVSQERRPKRCVSIKFSGTQFFLEK